MTEIRGRQKGKRLTLRGVDGQIRVTWPLVYFVYDSTGTATESQVSQTAGLPRINELVLVDGTPFPVACKEKVCEQDVKNNKEWTVTCLCDNEPFKASTESGTGAKEDDSPDPTTWQVLWDVTYERADMVVDTDRYGNPIRNFANRPYAEPVTEKILIPTIQFTQYEDASQSLRAITEREGAFNEGGYLGGVTGGWQLTIEDSDKVYRNGVFCWRLDYKLRYFEKVVTRLVSSNLLWTLNSDGTAVEVTTAGLTLTNEHGETVVGGWFPIRPQLDYIDISGNAVLDTKDNQILGKLEVTGSRVAAADQGSEGINYLLHQTGRFLDFGSFLRLAGAS